METVWYLLGGLALLGVLVLLFIGWALARRKRHLIERFGDAEIADKIIKSMYWRGQTAEQLRESLGEPHDIDHTALKTKTKEVWKYQPKGKRSYALKLTLDDGVVVGWEEK